MSSPSTSIVLSYFPVRGRAEGIRLLLEDAQIPYKYNAIAFGQHKSHAGALYGQLPTYEEESKKGHKFTLVETSAILHFVGKKAGLFPFCPYEAGRAEMIEHAIGDIGEKWVGFTKFNKGTREEVDAVITKFYTAWEKMLKEGGHDYINERICFADYPFFHILDAINGWESKWLNDYPTLKAFHTRMTNRPNIQAYFKSDRFIKA